MQTRNRIVGLLYKEKSVTRQEIASRLGLSMPTVLANVTELIASGMVYESGLNESTGGRKAKPLSLSQDVHYVVGLDLTRHHLRFVLEDIGKGVVRGEGADLDFQNDPDYFREMAHKLDDFIAASRVAHRKIEGVGISIPGIVNPLASEVSRSHILGITHVPLSWFSRNIAYPVCFANDAKNAALAEIPPQEGNVVYLSLNETVGGAFCQKQGLYNGDDWQSGEFGHMVIYPGGKRCYCGKSGCADPYLSSHALGENLEEFFKALADGDEQAKARFDAYTDALAILVSNLRMAFDCRILLGGDVGGYLSPYLQMIQRKAGTLNLFDPDGSYIETGHLKRESSAIGAAKRMAQLYLEQW